MIFWVMILCSLELVNNISEELIASIFRVEVIQVGKVAVCIGKIGRNDSWKEEVANHTQDAEEEMRPRLGSD
jgi:hypothetical protein